MSFGWRPEALLNHDGVWGRRAPQASTFSLPESLRRHAETHRSEIHPHHRAGPIVIGQACEFDYSGAQACKALKAEGYRVILVNSNPATIMTDPGLADATYVEPITPDMVEKIIAREQPDAILPTMGGQTALNTAMQGGSHSGSVVCVSG